MEEFKIVEFTRDAMFNSDYNIAADVPIDEVFENVLSFIPAVRGVVLAKNGVIAVRDRFLLQKLFRFIGLVNTGEVSQREVNRRKLAAENKETWFRDELEQIIIYLDRYDRKIKADASAKLYIRFINGEDSHSRWIDNMAILERLFILDIEQLIDYYKYDLNQKAFYELLKAGKTMGGGFLVKTDEQMCERLTSLGLLSRNIITYAKESQCEYQLTHCGVVFARIFDEIGYK